MPQTPRPSLVIFPIAGTPAPKPFALSQDVIVIGRTAACQVILNDPSISREHARLERREQGWHLTRLAGAEPIFVNGVAQDEADLRLGDQIVLGGTVLRLDVAAPPQDENGTLQKVSKDTQEIPTPRLKIRWPGGAFTAPLRDERLTLGRDPQSGIVIPSPLVSSAHAVLQRSGDGRYTIRDVGSVNGLLVQGKRTPARILANGDTLIIGEPRGPQQVVLTFEDPQQGATAQSSRGEVMATLGRDPASTYALASPLVSWQHAQLVRTSTGQVTLVDLGSTNGTYLNYQRVRAPQALQIGDRINIGPFELTFDGEKLTAIKTGQEGIRLEAHDIFRVTANGQSILLDNVSLAIQPGEFVAIAGGSGAGKTTLMRALAGIQRAQQGKIFFNDIDLYQHYDLFRGSIGYVPQADIVHSALTVERALYYAARLRLASDIRDTEIEERIKAVLATVDLSHRRSAVISSLSGGERKRVNIAVELLADPPIMFLDEPSAALDPNLRLELTETMRKLADKGRTIVLVTHHVEEIRACDVLAFMGSGGRLCYYGPPLAAMDYFNVPKLEKLYTLMSNPTTADEHRRAFRHSEIFQRYVQARLPRQAPPAGWAALQDQQVPEIKHLSFSKQLMLLMRRYVEIITQDRTNLIVLLLQAPIIGFVLAAVTDSGIFASPQHASTIAARTVLFFLAIIVVWFGTNNAAREICKEGEIYERERLAGLGVLPYLLSKITVLAVLIILQTLIMLIIVAGKSGLPPSSAGIFFPLPFELFLTLVFVGLAGLAMGLCISAFSASPDKAASLVPLVLIPQILLANVVFTLPKNSIMAPLAQLTVSRWAIQALGTSADLDKIYFFQHSAIMSINESNDFTKDFDSDPRFANYTPSLDPGVTWQDAVDSRRTHLLQTWFAIIVLGVGFMGAAAWRLRAKDPS